MEKKVAHYSLSSIKEFIKNDNYFITGSARRDYTSLGFSDESVIEIILELKPKDLYKSMTSYHDSKIWQDVYIKKLESLELYIKLQVFDNAIIISFKERT